MFYSKSTGGFYDLAIHGENIPTDAVEITNEEHAALMQGQSNGLAIGADENGHPVLIIPPPLTLAETVTKKKAAIAAYRYDKEVGGITLANGMTVATDDRSKGLIAGARIDTMADPTILTNWKADTGWVQIDADTVAMISSAVAAHVRACFTVEKTHCDFLDTMAADPATTPADIEFYDITTGWPG